MGARKLRARGDGSSRTSSSCAAPTARTPCAAAQGVR